MMCWKKKVKLTPLVDEESKSKLTPLAAVLVLVISGCGPEDLNRQSQQRKEITYTIQSRNGVPLVLAPSTGCAYSHSETYFSTHGQWRFDLGRATQVCGDHSDYLGINPAGKTPVAELLPRVGHRLLHDDGRFKTFHNGLPDPDAYTVVVFAGFDGESVYVYYPTKTKDSLIGKRRLNQNFEITYGVGMDGRVVKGEQLFEIDRAIKIYSESMIREK